MSDEQNQQADGSTGPDELTMLKERAKLMGITHSGNIGLEALRKKINDAIEGKNNEPENKNPDNETADEEQLNPLAGDKAGEVPAAKKSLRQIQQEEQLRLIRVRIQNLDPKKKDLPGEIFCVGNEVIGTVRKFIPYGEVTDNGYHIPYILYQELDSRRFQNIRTTKKHGQIKVETGWAKEFALEVLDPLTPEELARLAAAQAAAGGVSD